MNYSYSEKIERMADHYESKFYNDKCKFKPLLKNKYSKIKYKKNKRISISKNKEYFNKYDDHHLSIKKKTDKLLDIYKDIEAKYESYELYENVKEDKIHKLREFVINYIKSSFDHDNLLSKKLILYCKKKEWITYNIHLVDYWTNNNIYIDKIIYDDGTVYEGIIIKNIFDNPTKYPLLFGHIYYPIEDKIIKIWHGLVDSNFGYYDNFSYDFTPFIFNTDCGNNRPIFNNHSENGILSEEYYDDDLQLK